MYQRGSGVVVNTASVAGLVGHVDHAAYVASKHGIVGLTKVAGAEAAPYGVRVNAVAPVHTEMMDVVEAMKSPGDAGGNGSDFCKHPCPPVRDRRRRRWRCAFPADR